MDFFSRWRSSVAPDIGIFSLSPVAARRSALGHGLSARGGTARACFGAAMVWSQRPKSQDQYQDPGQGHWMGSGSLILELGVFRLVRAESNGSARTRWSPFAAERRIGSRHPPGPAIRGRSVLPLFLRWAVLIPIHGGGLAAEGLGPDSWQAAACSRLRLPLRRPRKSSAPGKSADPGFRDRCASQFRQPGEAEQLDAGQDGENGHPTANGRLPNASKIQLFAQ